jgi:hypothetical protein
MSACGTGSGFTNVFTPKKDNVTQCVKYGLGLIFFRGILKMTIVRFALAASVTASFAGISLTSPAAHASAHHMFEDEAALAKSYGDEKGVWNRANDPSTWSTHYNYQFDQLPLEGKMEDHTPWSDTYWPTREAGIAARWNWGSDVNGFKYKTYSEAQVRAMSRDELSRLSPAEKYDIFMGRFDYPTVKMVRDATSPHAEYWAGICHGWSPAALNHAEPMPVVVTSEGGIAVPFGSADVKALMDNYYANNAPASLFLGEKCQSGEGGNIFRRIASPFLKGPSCDDVNAGALHLILSNELGVRHQGFVADVDRWRQVWNQPVYAFTSRVTGARAPQQDAAPGTVREVLVHTDMFYADEIDATWTPVVGTPDFKKGVEAYEYSLELDGEGKIIGGQWLSENRPDFLWNSPKLQFTGYFSGINAVYRPSAR